MLRKDKILHFIAGAIIFISVYIITKNPYVSVGVGFLVGAIKEYVYDIRYPKKHTVDVFDFLWTVFGALLPYLIVMYIF